MDFSKVENRIEKSKNIQIEFSVDLTKFAIKSLHSQELTGIYISNKDNRVVKIIDKPPQNQGRCQFLTEQYIGLIEKVNSTEELSNILINYENFGTFDYNDELGIKEPYFYMIMKHGDTINIKTLTNLDLISICTKIDTMNKLGYIHGDIKLDNIVKLDDEIMFIDYEDTFQFNGCLNTSGVPLCRDLDKSGCPNSLFTINSMTLNFDKQGALLIYIFYNLNKAELVKDEVDFTKNILPKLKEIVKGESVPIHLMELNSNIISFFKGMNISEINDENFLDIMIKSINKMPGIAENSMVDTELKTHTEFIKKQHNTGLDGTPPHVQWLLDGDSRGGGRTRRRRSSKTRKSRKNKRFSSKKRRINKRRKSRK